MSKLKDRGRVYWCTALLFCGLGVLVGHLLDKQKLWSAWRYRVFGLLQQATPRLPYVKDTVIILIGDKEYWRGELAHRVPIRRDYLARLVRQLSRGDPAVIALDFDLRSPVSGAAAPEDAVYRLETAALLSAVRDVAAQSAVVLPRTIGSTEHGYVTRSDVYRTFDWGDVTHNVRFGYIALPFDKRNVPVALRLADGGLLDSFALAVARAFRPRCVASLDVDDGFPVGSFLAASEFPRYSAGRILRADRRHLSRWLQGRVVVVGGDWSRRGYADGGPIDMHETPVGAQLGAIVHANHIEALLDRRTLRPVPEWLPFVVEFAFGLFGAVILATQTRLARKAVFVVGMLAAVGVVSYAAVVNAGFYFDPVVPLVMVALHSVIEEARDREWDRKTDSSDGCTTGKEAA